MPNIINDTNTPQFTPYSGFSNINNDKIELTKIYLKIYIRLFLYIQFKLNKKFNKSINSYNSKYQIDESTLINSIKYYKQEQELDRYLQSNDIFFIQPLLKLCVKIIIMIYVSNILIVLLNLIFIIILIKQKNF